MSEPVRETICILLLATALFLCCLGCFPAKEPEAVMKAASGSSCNAEPVVISGGSINVNEADAEELIQLSGIGEVTAAAILDEREKNGLFFYPEDLLNVRGIGAKKLEGIRTTVNFDAVP